jgi:hypothetical protein
VTHTPKHTHNALPTNLNSPLEYFPHFALQFEINFIYRRAGSSEKGKQDEKTTTFWFWWTLRVVNRGEVEVVIERSSKMASATNAASYQSVSPNDYEVIGNVKAAMPQVIEFSRQKLDVMKKYVEDGDWTLRLAGLAAGVSIVITALLSFLSDLTSFSPFYALLDVYLLAFGILMVALEYRERLFPLIWLQCVRREALFLYKPYGRAAFYFFAGILLIAKGGLFG